MWNRSCVCGTGVTYVEQELRMCNWGCVCAIGVKTEHCPGPDLGM